MILVDTSVWVNHLRTNNEYLTELLECNKVLVHPFIVGELACGNLHNRTGILKLLSDLPQTLVATTAEVLFFIEQHKLMGCGIGYVDAHLLTSTALATSTRLWTRDKPLRAAAASLELTYTNNIR